MTFSHTPVLLSECIEGLAIRPDGVYLDGTLGGGGHSAEILKRLTSGRLYGIDRDETAIRAAGARLHGPFTAIHGNFHDAPALLAERGVTALDGVLLDLGVSSPQLDVAERGFSYHEDAPLDMRMDRRQALTAADIVNAWSEAAITRILRDYGEEKWAARIAHIAVERRPVTTTGQLVAVIDAAIPAAVRKKEDSHPARRTFQALRIAVNDELEPLRQALIDLTFLLKPGGRLCVIAFHSLEDRVVKNAMRDLMQPCVCPPSFPVCVCGRQRAAVVLTKKPIVAGAKELKANPRARSATLRICERVEGERWPD